MSDAPDTPALTAWHEAHTDSRRDRPVTRLWFPEEAPYAILQTISRGHDEPDVLPSGPPCVDVHLGGGIQIGGYLSEMEAYFAAAVEAIRHARWLADELTAEQAKAGAQ